MKYFNFILRFLWGAHFLVFGLNKWVVFQQVPAANPFSQMVIDQFYGTGYLMETVGFFEILTGLLILGHRFFPLAVIIAFPISLNIALFTLFTVNYSINAVFTGILVFGANIYFICLNRKKYLPLLENKTSRGRPDLQ